MKSLFLLPAGLLLTILLSGCVANTMQDYDYTQFRAEDPHSILIIPPVNNAIDVDAPAFYLSTIARPVGERGYYVFPVSMVKTLLDQDGLSDANLVHDADPTVLANMFGADSVLYVTIQRWDAQYIVVNTQVTVQFDYTLRSGSTGDVLWNESATRVYSSDSGNAGGLAGLIADAIVAAVAKAAPSYVPLAKQANAQATTQARRGVPAGKYHPMHGKDGELFPSAPTEAEVVAESEPETSTN